MSGVSQRRRSYEEAALSGNQSFLDLMKRLRMSDVMLSIVVVESIIISLDGLANEMESLGVKTSCFIIGLGILLLLSFQVLLELCYLELKPCYFTLHHC